MINQPLYLTVDSCIKIVGGIGTESDPYIIAKGPSVGDYVKYEPDDSADYILATDVSGHNTTLPITYAHDPKTWQIMSADTDGNVNKIIGGVSSSQFTIYLKGALGYNNGVFALNDICKKRYTKSSWGITANDVHNLTIEDIEEGMTESGIETLRNSYKNSNGVQYGETKKYSARLSNYPSLYAQERYSGVGVSDVRDGTQIINDPTGANIASKNKLNPNGKTQSDSIYTSANTGTASAKGASLTAVQTYYYTIVSDSYFKNSIFHKLMLGTSTSYWLASRYVGSNSILTGANFGIRSVQSSYISGNALYYSNGTNLSANNRIRPVVTLNSNIKVKSGSGTELDPYILGK